MDPLATPVTPPSVEGPSGVPVPDDVATELALATGRAETEGTGSTSGAAKADTARIETTRSAHNVRRRRPPRWIILGSSRTRCPGRWGEPEPMTADTVVASAAPGWSVD